MKRLEEMPRTADEMLGGLEATDALKMSILKDAQAICEGKKVPARNTPWSEKTRRTKSAQALRTVAAMSCLAVFTLGLLVGIPAIISQKNTSDALITTQTAGGENEPKEQALAVPQGSITISQREKPAYRGVWEAATGANFPLVCVDGRYYRLMSNPTAIDGAMLGDALGAVDTFTSEPAMASGAVVSNVLPEGETVYAVLGMDGAAVAANVNGALRVFQRVSYGTTGLKAGETLSDTLQASSVVAMELTGVGTVTDRATAQRLYAKLLGSAVLVRAGASETTATLLIQLENGLVLQMNVRDESVMACGTWECPEFFEAFREAVK